MVSDRALLDATVWVLAGLVVAGLGTVVGELLLLVPLVGQVLFAAVWLVVHFYAVKLALRGIAVLVEDVVARELERRAE